MITGHLLPSLENPVIAYERQRYGAQLVSPAVRHGSCTSSTSASTASMSSLTTINSSCEFKMYALRWMSRSSRRPSCWICRFWKNSSRKVSLHRVRRPCYTSDLLSSRQTTICWLDERQLRRLMPPVTSKCHEEAQEEHLDASQAFDNLDRFVCSYERWVEHPGPRPCPCRSVRRRCVGAR